MEGGWVDDQTQSRRVAALLCLVIWPAADHSRSAELMDAQSQCSEPYRKGRYKEALLIPKNVLELDEEVLGPNDPATATLLDKLASEWALGLVENRDVEVLL